jgi:hypothetical protein
LGLLGVSEPASFLITATSAATLDQAEWIITIAKALEVVGVTSAMAEDLLIMGPGMSCGFKPEK